MTTTRHEFTTRREFTIANEVHYDHRSPLRWLFSHIWRYPFLLITFFLTTVGMAGSQSMSAVMVGRAFDTVISEQGRTARAGPRCLRWLPMSATASSTSSTAWRSVCWHSAFLEWYARVTKLISASSKSQTFHGRQRVGDLMARVTNDVQQVNQFVSRHWA